MCAWAVSLSLPYNLKKETFWLGRIFLLVLVFLLFHFVCWFVFIFVCSDKRSRDFGHPLCFHGYSESVFVFHLAYRELAFGMYI